MEQNGILAFRQYVEALGKAHAIRQYMEEQTDINVLGLFKEIHVYGIETLEELAEQYKQPVVRVNADEGLAYQTYASFQIHSKEHNIQFTVFCYTDRKTGEDS